MSPRPIRLLDIAAEAGVSVSTASMALSNHPRIADKTKATVRKACEKLGYHPDPAARALAGKKSSGNGYLGTLAVLEGVDFLAQKQASPHHKMWDEQFGAVCQGMGYRVDRFRVEAAEKEQRALSRILKARGINGLIINGFNDEVHQWKIDWSDFAAVAYSGSLHEHFIHNVTSSSYQDVYDAMQRLKNKKYQRPGYFMSPRFDHWSAGFSSAVEGWGAKSRVPKLAMEENPDQPIGRGKLLRWYERYKPDVIVANSSDLLIRVFAEAGIRIPDDVGYLCLDVSETMSHLSGLIQKHKEAYQVAVDLLHSMLMRHEYGPPAQPFCIQIPSTWNEGKTLL